MTTYVILGIAIYVGIGLFLTWAMMNLPFSNRREVPMINKIAATMFITAFWPIILGFVLIKK